MRREQEIYDDDSPETDVLEGSVFEGKRFAYIKSIGLNEARAMGLVIPSEIKLPENVRLYALHAADGRTLGVTDNWASAYGAAVQNNFVPLSVH